MQGAGRNRANRTPVTLGRNRVKRREGEARGTGRTFGNTGLASSGEPRAVSALRNRVERDNRTRRRILRLAGDLPPIVDVLPDPER